MVKTRILSGKFDKTMVSLLVFAMLYVYRNLRNAGERLKGARLLNERLLVLLDCPVGGVANQPARIEEVLRAVIAQGPAVVRVEFDAKEVPDFAKHTVAYDTDEFTFGVGHTDLGAERDGLVNLDTGARERDIFQVGDNAPPLAGWVHPV
jgi:hypothetical protein